MPANDRGYGLGRAAGGFPVAIATKEMRAQRLPKAHYPPKAHRRVLGVGVLLHFISRSSLNYSISLHFSTKLSYYSLTSISSSTI